MNREDIIKQKCAHEIDQKKCDWCKPAKPELLSKLASTNDFVMVHSNELQAILDYVEDMEQRISIAREQLQYLVAESAESDEE